MNLFKELEDKLLIIKNKQEEYKKAKEFKATWSNDSTTGPSSPMMSYRMVWLDLSKDGTHTLNIVPDSSTGSITTTNTINWNENNGTGSIK